ncbi:predicted protein [Nematostella vectensis]|uniref:RRM domain-containing protein n=1 Tax=Nematostella vectensis TaxID=45351 RepID=A7SW98_NEMVE|nr:predicted protein [Nematostella vectensis]|eukprot:XP_001624115.1 predicted protein [Nematostella vectensis]
MSTLWMGDLDQFADEAFVASAFAAMGESVASVKMIKNRITGGPAGYCFVDFGDTGTAQKVMSKLNGLPIPGSNPIKRFKLNWATYAYGKESTHQGPEFSIFVGDLTPDVNDHMLQVRSHAPGERVNDHMLQVRESMITCSRGNEGVEERESKGSKEDEGKIKGREVEEKEVKEREERADCGCQSCNNIYVGKPFSHLQKSLSQKTLQTKDTTLQEAITTATLARSHYSRLRSDAEFDSFYQSCVDFAFEKTSKPVLPRYRRRPTRLDDGSAPHRHDTPKDHYSAQYFEVCYLIQAALDTRFNQEKLKPVATLEELVLVAANSQDFSALLGDLQASCYRADIDLDRLRHQIHMLPDVISQALPNVKQVRNVRTEFFQSRFPSCKAAKVVLDASGNSRGYGFVRFFDEKEHKRAMVEMQGAVGCGSKPIRVSAATPKRPPTTTTYAATTEATPTVAAQYGTQYTPQQYQQYQQYMAAWQGYAQQQQQPYYQQYQQQYAAPVAYGQDYQQQHVVQGYETDQQGMTVDNTAEGIVRGV